MYQEIKSCVSFNGSESSFFQRYRGVRQGEKLSPVLFVLFLNDLESFLSENNCGWVNLKMSDVDLSIYIKIFILLYADYTVIFGTDEVSCQNNMNAFFECPKIWKRDINFDTIKIPVFGTRKDDRFNFKLDENAIATCNDLKYLSVI